MKIKLTDTMKVAGISDLHGYLPDNIPTCNVLCISGDIIPLNIQRKSFASIRWWLRDFCNWVSRLPCEKVILTAGNHDFILEQLYKSNLFYKFTAMLEQYSNNKAILLINEKYTYKGISFYGFPYIRPIPFQENKWAFVDNFKDIDNTGVYRDIPREGIDVLISHDTPIVNMCLDNVLESIVNKPIIFCGHWHNGYSDPLQGLYNCSIKDNFYNIKRNFEIPVVSIGKRENLTEEILRDMLESVGKYTALRNYDNFQVNAIKDFLVEYKKDLFNQQEDDIPLPVTGNIIEEEHEEDDY